MDKFSKKIVVSLIMAGAGMLIISGLSFLFLGEDIDPVLKLASTNSYQRSWTEYNYLLFASIVINFVLGILLIYFLITKSLRTKIYVRINHILSVANIAAVGDLSKKSNLSSNDQIAKLSKALNTIIENQNDAAEFANKIGDGDLITVYQKKSEEDKLGEALIRMQNKLKTVAIEDKKRTWANEGYAKFSELLRDNTDSLRELSEALLVELVGYLGVNQGAIFLLEETAEGVSLLKMRSAYAWGRNKHAETSFKIGEGLIGQAYQERDTIFVTDVPEDFIRIGSGLGDANPRCILIVPLKVSEEIHGVIEFAAFKTIEQYQIEFVERLAESIASSISTVQVNERTKELLRESQLLTEQLRIQEEELRQNTEELQATQENIARNLENIKAEKEKNMAILEGCVDCVISFTEDGEIEFFNKAAEEILMRNSEDVLGKNITSIMPLNVRLENGRVVAEFDNDGSIINVDVRTEVSIYDSTGEEVPVLMTLSYAAIENEYFFTVFVQSIAVELF